MVGRARSGANVRPPLVTARVVSVKVTEIFVTARSRWPATGALVVVTDGGGRVVDAALDEEVGSCLTADGDAEQAAPIQAIAAARATVRAALRWDECLFTRWDG